jgi:hypothetical protein
MVPSIGMFWIIDAGNGTQGLPDVDVFAEPDVGGPWNARKV